MEQMKTYTICVLEKREATYRVKAKSLSEAKKDAKWRLLTSTRPAVEPQYTYTYLASEIYQDKNKE